MRKISVAVMCVAGVLSIQASSASRPIPIRFIYAKAGATYEAFQSDRDVCARHAKKKRYSSFHDGRWTVDDWPKSTVFLNCMAQKGYTLAKDGWDTGVLWTLPYLRRAR